MLRVGKNIIEKLNAFVLVGCFRSKAEEVPAEVEEEEDEDSNVDGTLRSLPLPPRLTMWGTRFLREFELTYSVLYSLHVIIGELAHLDTSNIIEGRRTRESENLHEWSRVNRRCRLPRSL